MASSSTGLRDQTGPLSQSVSANVHHQVPSQGLKRRIPTDQLERGQSNETNSGTSGTLNAGGPDAMPIMDEHPTLRQQLRATFTCSWTMIFIPMVPTGFLVNYLEKNPSTIFAINFLAVLSSGSILGFALEQIPLHADAVRANLLNASFGYVTLFREKASP